PTAEINDDVVLAERVVDPRRRAAAGEDALGAERGDAGEGESGDHGHGVEALRRTTEHGVLVRQVDARHVADADADGASEAERNGRARVVDLAAGGAVQDTGMGEAR